MEVFESTKASSSKRTSEHSILRIEQLNGIGNSGLQTSKQTEQLFHICIYLSYQKITTNNNQLDNKERRFRSRESDCVTGRRVLIMYIAHACEVVFIYKKIELISL